MHSSCAPVALVALHTHHDLCGLHGLLLCHQLHGDHRTDLCLCVVVCLRLFLRRVSSFRGLCPTLCHHHLVVHVLDICLRAHALCNRGLTSTSLHLPLVLRPCVLANANVCALCRPHVSHRALGHAPNQNVSKLRSNGGDICDLHMRLFQTRVFHHL